MNGSQKRQAAFQTRAHLSLLAWDYPACREKHEKPLHCTDPLKFRCGPACGQARPISTEFSSKAKQCALQKKKLFAHQSQAWLSQKQFSTFRHSRKSLPQLSVQQHIDILSISKHKTNHMLNSLLPKKPPSYIGLSLKNNPKTATCAPFTSKRSDPIVRSSRAPGRRSKSRKARAAETARRWAAAAGGSRAAPPACPWELYMWGCKLPGT